MLNQMTSSEKPVRMQGLNSSRLTSPRATSQNTKILLGFFVILAWSWGLCRARTFPPIARACQLCQGTSGSLKSQQLLCCLCIFLCCQELNWEAVRLSCTCGMMQRAWRVKENKGKLWCSLSPTQSFQLAKPGFSLPGSSFEHLHSCFRRIQGKQEQREKNLFCFQWGTSRQYGSVIL